MKFLCRATDHELSQCVLEAFAEGTPGALFSHLSGVVYPVEIPVYYGILRGCGDAIKEDMRQGRPFVYIDHGYFKDNVSFAGHYRLVVGGLHPKIPEWPKPEHPLMPGEFLPMQPLRHSGPVVLIPPSQHVANFYGIDVADWARRFKTPFVNTIVSTKADNNLDELLKTCHGVLAHSSTGAVRALYMGLPAWCTAERAPIPNHGQYLREDLLNWLSERQFTLGEIRDGRHLQFLRREIENFRPEGVRSPGVGGGDTHTKDGAFTHDSGAAAPGY